MKTQAFFKNIDFDVRTSSFFFIIITFNFQLNDIESKCLENNLTYSFVVFPN